MMTGRRTSTYLSLRRFTFDLSVDKQDFMRATLNVVFGSPEVRWDVSVVKYRRGKCDASGMRSRAAADQQLDLRVRVEGKTMEVPTGCG